jgi:hypothetical protein
MNSTLASAINNIFKVNDSLNTASFVTSYVDFDLPVELSSLFFPAVPSVEEEEALQSLTHAIFYNYWPHDNMEMYYHTREHIKIALFILLRVFNKEHSELCSPNYLQYTRMLAIALIFHDAMHSLGKAKDSENIKNALVVFDEFVDSGALNILFKEHIAAIDKIIATIRILIIATEYPHTAYKDLRNDKAYPTEDLITIMHLVDCSTGILGNGASLVYRGLYNELAVKIPYGDFLLNQTKFIASMKKTITEVTQDDISLCGLYDGLLFNRLWGRFAENHAKLSEWYISKGGWGSFNDAIPVEAFI